MIVFVVICLRLTEWCSSFSRSRASSKATSRISVTYTSRVRRRLNEALLPAFAAFILLSYTKFSLTSSYIITTQRIVNENGTQVGHRVFYAGQYSTVDEEYQYQYLFPSVIIFCFVCAVPILLLVIPLQLFEKLLSRSKSLWKLYPVDKVHFFLDTFQGCYKIKMRFFAGLYFVFRLTINVAFIASDSWYQLFTIQEIMCILMLTLVSVCHPYNAEYNILNYVDPFIFANLAVINVLGLYLSTSSLNGQPISLSSFIVRYILIFLPLFYMILYVVWYALFHQDWLLRRTLRLMKKYILANRSSLGNFVVNDHSRTAPHTVTEVSMLEEEQEEDAFLARAEESNKFQRGSPGGSTSINGRVHSLRRTNSTDKGNGTNSSVRYSNDSNFRSTHQPTPGYGTMSSSDRSNTNSSRATHGTSGTR